MSTRRAFGPQPGPERAITAIVIAKLGPQVRVRHGPSAFPCAVAAPLAVESVNVGDTVLIHYYQDKPYIYAKLSPGTVVASTGSAATIPYSGTVITPGPEMVPHYLMSADHIDTDPSIEPQTGWVVTWDGRWYPARIPDIYDAGGVMIGRIEGAHIWIRLRRPPGNVVHEPLPGDMLIVEVTNHSGAKIFSFDTTVDVTNSTHGWIGQDGRPQLRLEAPTHGADMPDDALGVVVPVDGLDRLIVHDDVDLVDLRDHWPWLVIDPGPVGEGETVDLAWMRSKLPEPQDYPTGFLIAESTPWNPYEYVWWYRDVDNWSLIGGAGWQGLHAHDSVETGGELPEYARHDHTHPEYCLACWGMRYGYHMLLFDRVRPGTTIHEYGLEVTNGKQVPYLSFGVDSEGVPWLKAGKVGKKQLRMTVDGDVELDGTGTGDGDMDKSTYDPDDDGQVEAADEADHAAAADSVPWTGVTDKPATFPPDAHTHAQLHDPVTKQDTTTVGITLTGQEIQAAVIPGGIKLDDLGTPDDNTDLDASTERHGLAPKLYGGTARFWRADGTWAEPPAGGPGGGADPVLAAMGLLGWA